MPAAKSKTHLASGAAEQAEDRGVGTESNSNTSAGVAAPRGRQSLCKGKAWARGSLGIIVPLLPEKTTLGSSA